MALSDYRTCDVCGGKAFYDSNLNYQQGGSFWCVGGAPYREAGEPQFDDPELLEKHGTRLDSVGDWAVICTECAKTHKCVIVEIGEARNG